MWNPFTRRKEPGPVPRSERVVEESPSTTYRGDRPVADPSQDRFNRWPFAKRVAETLIAREDTSCLVIGIYGAWGEGKTSTLNFVAAELGGRSDIAVVRFNPWYFRSEALILRSLFETIAEGVGEKLSTLREQLGEALGKLSSFLSLASVSVGGGAVSVNPAEGLQKIAGELSQVSIDAQRLRVQSILRDAGIRIVVMIDDIDRLERQEIQSLFKIVRLAADFERVSYILAFDHQVVSASLGERYGEGGLAQGRAFLEKIIQVPLHLPPARSQVLRQIAFEGVDSALAIAGINLTDGQVNSFSTQFVRGLLAGLATPRQAQLYSNALLFALPILKGEVDVVDQMLIEAIRVFYPGLYGSIRREPAVFLRPPRHRREDDENAANRLTEILKSDLPNLSDEERRQVTELLEFLFPRTRKTTYDWQWDAKWFQEQHVCSSDYFDRYFTYSVGQHELPDRGLVGFAERIESGDIDDSRTAWLELVEAYGARHVIEKLRRRSEIVGDIGASRLSALIAVNGAQFLHEPHYPKLDSTRTNAGLLVVNLIEGRRENLRVKLAAEALALAEPLTFAVEIFEWMQPTGEFKPLREDDLITIGRDLAQRIARACRAEWIYSVYDREDARILLSFWRDHGDSDDLRQYLAGELQQECARVAEFLLSFVCDSLRTRLSGIAGHVVLDRRIYDKVTRFVDPAVVYDLIKQAYGKVELGGLPRDGAWYDLAVVSQFIYVHEQVAREGE